MSKMGNIDMEIRDMLEQDVNPKQVAEILQVPLGWVYATLASMQEENMEFDPYNTVNS